MWFTYVSENRSVTHWFIGLEFAKSDGIKNVDLTYDIQSFTDLGEPSAACYGTAVPLELWH